MEEFKEKLKLAKDICEEECGIIYMSKDVDISYDHFCSDVRILYLKENPETTNRAVYADIEHLEKRIRNDVSSRWQIGLLVDRPEIFAWYTGEEDET